jgi:hypothetical protein
MQPDADIVDRYIWQPLSEIDVPIIFAFGSPWIHAAQATGLREVLISDVVRTFTLRSGQRLAIQNYGSRTDASYMETLRRSLSSTERAVGAVSSARSARSDHDGLQKIALDAAVTKPSTTHAVVRPPSGKPDYERFWSAFVQRLGQERSHWRVGAHTGNDLRLLDSALPHTQLKYNFPREGLRLELLLCASSKEENLRHLQLLKQNRAALQAAFGSTATLHFEDLPGRTKQARMAVYASGRIEDERRWPEFERWFIDVGDRMRAALASVPDLERSWEKGASW